MQSIEIWAEQYKGIIFYVDSYGNVYDSEEIFNLQKKQDVASSKHLSFLPKVIGRYIRKNHKEIQYIEWNI